MGLGRSFGAWSFIADLVGAAMRVSIWYRNLPSNVCT